MKHLPGYIEQSWRFHQATYAAQGAGAQRIYPSEDVVRFAATRLNKSQRLSILDVGSGAGANAVTLARMSPSWSVVALDFCDVPIDLILRHGLENLTARLDFAPALATVAEHSVDVVIDHMCSYGLMLKDLEAYVTRLTEVLRPGGLVYIKTLSDGCDMIQDFPPETLVEERTLARISRPTAPFPDDDYLFRFSNPIELTSVFGARGFETLQMEKLSRTYRFMQEYYEQINAVFRYKDE